MLHQNPEHRRARRPTWGMRSVGISMLELLRHSKRESLCTAASGCCSPAQERRNEEFKGIPMNSSEYDRLLGITITMNYYDFTWI